MDRLGLGSTRALYLRLAGSAPGDAGVRALLAADVDWATLRALGQRDGVSGELWRRLRAAGPEVPEELAAAWAREAKVADFQLLRAEAHLARLHTLLTENGDEPLLLKGAAMAYAAHGGIRRRPMADVDLLVHAERLEGAVSQLEQAGWRPLAARAAYATHHHAPPLADPAGEGVIAELHRALLPGAHPFRFAAAEVRDRAGWATVPWGRALLPASDDLLLHVCIHFAWSHELRWGAWRAFADLAALFAAPDTAWLAGAPDRMAAAGAERAVGWTLRLAQELGGVPVPPPLAALLTAVGGGRALERHLAHQLLPGPGVTPSVWLARRAWTTALRPPAAAGSGARPWHGAPAPRGAAPAPVRSPLSRLARQLGRPAAWLRYGRAVLGGRARG